MGITGLIPFLEKASKKINVKDLKGSTVAVDTYCWLHKGAIGCADKLSRGEYTDMHIKFCLKFVNLLLSNNVKPILIFDGQHLPAKALTESRRRETRKCAKKKAAELLRLGRIDEARSYMKRCINITHEMALQLIKECRKINVDCIVAPYEADAQIAYLNKLNIAQYVITEDSDLALFGCKKIIFKFDLAGNGLLIESDKYHLAMGCHIEKFSIDKFRYMCILSGCDYLDSLPGIGLAKACKFILMTEETDMKRALLKIPPYLNMRHLIVTEDYIENFLKADATFKHMFVYNPIKRKMIRLNELEDFGTDIEYCSNAGQCLDDETAFQLALGNIHPFTYKKLDDWNPDIKVRCLKSIWRGHLKFDDSKLKTGDNCALEFKKINYTTSHNSYVEEKDERQTVNEVLSFYISPKKPVSIFSDQSPKKRRRSSSSNSNNSTSSENRSPNKTPIQNTHNPFVKFKTKKLNLSSSNLQNCASDSSLIKSLSPAKRKIETIIVKSRFFASNHELLNQETVISNEVQNEIKDNLIDSETTENLEENENLENLVQSETIEKIKIMEKIEELHKEQISTSLCLSSPEIEKDKGLCYRSSEHTDKSSPSSSSNKTKEIETLVIEDDSPRKQSEIKRKKSFKVGLSKPSKSQKLDKKQSRLSMFGFQKRSSLIHK